MTEFSAADAIILNSRKKALMKTRQRRKKRKNLRNTKKRNKKVRNYPYSDTK